MMMIEARGLAEVITGDIQPVGCRFVNVRGAISVIACGRTVGDMWMNERILGIMGNVRG
jgi:hypothetical protein